jgi:hypothetical protein
MPLKKLMGRHLVAAAAADGAVRFKDMFDGVDVDEKWFYQTSDGKNYILTAAEHDQMERYHEKEPRRTISHKNHITKVMFLLKQEPGGTHTHTQLVGMARLVFGQLDILLLHKEQASTQACRDTSVAR